MKLHIFLLSLLTISPMLNKFGYLHCTGETAPVEDFGTEPKDDAPTQDPAPSDPAPQESSKGN